MCILALIKFTSEPIVIKHVVKNSEAKASEAKPKVVRKNNGAPIIEDWVLDSEEENVSQTKIEKKTVKSSFAKIKFVKPKQQEKTARKSVNHVKQNRQNTHTPRGNQRNWNNMMSQRLGINAARHNLLLLLEVNAARHNLLLLLKVNAARHKLTTVKTVNGEVQLQALVDGKKIIITESTVRRDFQLEDAEGVDYLPNSTIFKQLTLMGYEKIS
ncbi:hypothetical protein Tco_0707232 [Tanacetum coccineum]|uniref:Uncharacterized protein n=1 Tax=Tanacetum coccineum TaxID=301880 RepID=A0ABQ4YAP9_9ASTR